MAHCGAAAQKKTAKEAAFLAVFSQIGHRLAPAARPAVG
jgi:hypothetical protein